MQSSSLIKLLENYYYLDINIINPSIYQTHSFSRQRINKHHKRGSWLFEPS